MLYILAGITTLQLRYFQNTAHNKNHKNMHSPSLLIIAFLVVLASTQTIVTNPILRTSCLAYQGGKCINCPYNFHVQNNQCYRNIYGCLNHTRDEAGIIKCLQCDLTISTPDNRGGCIVSVSEQEIIHTRYYSGLVSQYGDFRFQSIRISQALSDTYFSLANNFMLNGQYRSFISKSSQPVRSVSFFKANGEVQYRILYNGSGGGLMLCIITVKTANNAIILNSFVLIALTNVVQFCEQYSLSIQCLQCAPGYHLENSVCYPNIENCISYYQNICIECSGHSYLIENRCVTECEYMSDSGQLDFFGDFRLRSASALIINMRSYLLF